MTNTQAILFQAKYKIDVLTDGTFRIIFKSSPASISESLLIKSEQELDELVEAGIVQFSVHEWNEFVKNKTNVLTTKEVVKQLPNEFDFVEDYNEW